MPLIAKTNTSVTYTETVATIQFRLVDGSSISGNVTLSKPIGIDEFLQEAPKFITVAPMKKKELPVVLRKKHIISARELGRKEIKVKTPIDL